MKIATSTTTSKTVYLIIAAGLMVCFLSFGLRATMGLFMAPIDATHGWGRETISIAVAIQNLFWGIVAPGAGYLASRFGNVKVIIIGAIIYALGLALIPIVDSPLALNTTMGVLLGTGIAATSFGIVLPAMARMVDASKRAMVLGLGTAGGSAGQFLVVLLAQNFIGEFGWQDAFFLLSTIGVFNHCIRTAAFKSRRWKRH